jgi:SAM-dependent methyltransferase
LTSRAAAVEPHPYRDFERAGWQSAAPRYPWSFAPATAPYAEPLLDAVDAGPGVRLLDIACGPGVVAAAALRRGCTVTGVDFSAAMLGEARRRLPDAAFHDADAEALPLASGGFDAAVSNFGLHHFPFPVRALAEARRVLRPGGRLAVTVWARADANVAWKIVIDAIAAHGEAKVVLPSAPLGRLERAETCARLLVEAGFAADAIAGRDVHAHWPLAAPADLFDGFLAGTVRMAGMIAAERPEIQTRIRATVAAAIAAFRRDGGYAVPTAAILVGATNGRP